MRRMAWLRCGPMVGFALSIGLAYPFGLANGSANAATTLLSNGAELAVSIEQPVTSTEFQVPAGEPDIDVDVDGTASVGLGDPDATIIYVIDESGSTNSGGGTGCSPILTCEKQFFLNLNNAAIADGSTDLAGVVHYASSSSIQQTLIALTDPAIPAAINAASAGGMTNCAAGLNNATALVTSAANTNGTNLVVFASDGLCNEGGAVAPAANALGATGAVVHSIAIGSGSSCTTDGGTGRLNQIPQNGGQCFAVADPGNLPNLIQNLIGSTLDSLEIKADAGAYATIPNAQISLPLPQPGAVSVTYGLVSPTTVADLDPNDHTICVQATGSDVLGDTQSVAQCNTIHLLQLTASPPDAVNELSEDNEHTVTAAIIGGSGPVRNIDFVVGGKNAGTATPANASIPAAPNTPVDFVYTVPEACTSLGTDTITVSTVIAGIADAIEVTKDWVDTTPPVASCIPSVNPHGNNEPAAPGNGGQGQNQDGFYLLWAEDNLAQGCDPLVIWAVDEDGVTFGPFDVGDVIKYTQDDDAPQEIKRMGSTGGGNKGKSDAVTAHLKGHGDLTITATDPAGNISDPAFCLVPKPPK